jgi:hypothetical protein
MGKMLLTCADFDRIAEIEARVEAATPAPWLQGKDVKMPHMKWEGYVTVYCDDPEEPTSPPERILLEMNPHYEKIEEDARFIANAPTDIRFLLEQLKERDDRIAELEADLFGASLG